MKEQDDSGERIVPLVENLASAEKDGKWYAIDTDPTVTMVSWVMQVDMWRFLVMNDDHEAIDHGFVEDGTEFYTTGETA